MKTSLCQLISVVGPVGRISAMGQKNMNIFCRFQRNRRIERLFILLAVVAASVNGGVKLGKTSFLQLRILEEDHLGTPCKLPIVRAVGNTVMITGDHNYFCMRQPGKQGVYLF